MLDNAARPSQTTATSTATTRKAAGVVGVTDSGSNRASSQSSRPGTQSVTWLSGPSTTSAAAARDPVIPASTTSPTRSRSSTRSAGGAATSASAASSASAAASGPAGGSAAAAPDPAA